jgi:hypothetical protein
LSNEEIYYQDLASFPNMIQLLTKGEKSRIVTRENMWDELTHRLKKKIDVGLMPDMYPIVLAFTGYKEYSLDGFNRMAVGRGIPFVEKHFDMSYSSVQSFENALEDSDIFTTEADLNKVLTNFALLSHEAQEKISYNKSFINMIEQRINTNYKNPQEVMKINEKYFQRFPILIDYLFEGEEY